MKKISFEDLTIRKFHESLKNKEFRALEAVQAYYERIKERDVEIGAYLSLAEDEAMRTAEEVDLAIERGENISPLAGVPFGVKDAILVKGQQATSGSQILKNYVASYDAGAIQRLRSERAIFLGKTNMDEFAMGTSTENSSFQITRNPHDIDRVPGGSSGGSAAAVAGEMALAALGSDTGGSIRQPAAFCGVVGLKPTYGAVSRSGLIALTSSLDQIGPLTKTVEDAALIFKTIAGHDPMDSTSAHIVYDKELAKELLEPDFKTVAKLRVGIPEEYFIDGMSPEIVAGVEKAMKDIEAMGLKTERVSLPHTKSALACYYIINPAEASSNLARFDGIRYSQNADVPQDLFSQRGAGFGPEPTRRIILGTFVLSSGHHDAYYKKSQAVRALIKRDFDRAFEKVDVILAPVVPNPPFRIGEKVNDPLSLYLEDIFTVPMNLAGVPSVSIPVRNHDSKMPVSFQLVGRAFREADILGLGQMYEKA